MNFYDTRTNYLKLDEEISKVRTQADFNNIENHIKENLYSLTNKQIKSLVESFNKKGGNLNAEQILNLKEAIEDDNFDLDVEDEDYVDVDDDENIIDEGIDDNPQDYKTVKVSNIEPYFTMEDIDPLVADDLGMTNEDYLEQCKEYIRIYFKESIGDPFYLDVPVDYLESNNDLEEYIAEYISDETGYLTDGFDYELFDEDENKEDDKQVEEQVEVENVEVQEPVAEDSKEEIQECDNKPKNRYKIEAISNSKEGENK